jgi:hypothetical protein
MIRYPPTYINGQFKYFFDTYINSSISSSTVFVLANIHDDKLFFEMRTRLLSYSAKVQTPVEVEAVTVDEKHKRIVHMEEERSALHLNDPKHKKGSKRLILHYTHEKRFQSYKRDLHQIWSEIFVNTPAYEVQVIVGNRNNQDAKRELVKKRPNPSLLIIKGNPGKYRALCSGYLHVFYLGR